MSNEFDPAHFEGDPDAWMIVDAVGSTFVRGPFPTFETAQEALEDMDCPPGMVVSPVWF